MNSRDALVRCLAILSKWRPDDAVEDDVLRGMWDAAVEGGLARRNDLTEEGRALVDGASSTPRERDPAAWAAAYASAFARTFDSIALALDGDDRAVRTAGLVDVERCKLVADAAVVALHGETAAPVAAKLAPLESLLLNLIDRIDTNSKSLPPDIREEISGVLDAARKAGWRAP